VGEIGAKYLSRFFGIVNSGLRMEVVKSVALDLLKPTRAKQRNLLELESRYREALSFIVSQGIKVKRHQLQAMFYGKVRAFGLHSQVANDLFKDAVAILNNGGKVGRVTVPYNIPRSGRFSITKRGNPMVSIATLNGRMAIPICKDGNYRRYREMLEQGYKTTFFRLSHSNIYVALKKDFEVKQNYESVLGVDVGVKRLATVSIINAEGRILRQLYLGQDVGNKQRDIDLRRSKLRSYADDGSRCAKQALRRLRKYESNYTTTRCWQIAHEIVRLAEQYNAFIALEDLKNLKNSKGNRKGNRKAKRMPYHRFRVALESVAWQFNRLVVAIYARGTSHICSKCGAKGVRNRGFFKCPKCGYEANADRNASINVAIRAGINHPKTNGFFAQFSDGNLAVNQGALVHDEIGVKCLQHKRHLRDKPTILFVGS